MLRKKELKLFLLLDADDCIYNNTYRYLVLSIINEFGDKISSLNENPNANKTRQLVSKIMDFLTNIILQEKGKTFTDKILNQIELSFYKTQQQEFEAYSANLDPSINPYNSGFISSEICKYLSFIDNFGNYGIELYKHILLSANIEFFDYFLSRIKNEGFDDLTIMSVSNRGVEHDARNAKVNGTGLFNRDIIYVCELFNDLLKYRKVKCSYNDFTMHKVYNGVMSVWDETKFSLYFSASHEIGILHPSSDNVIAIFDDRLDILTECAEKFASDLSLYPSSKFEFWKYMGRIYEGRRYINQHEISAKESISSVIAGEHVLVLHGKGVALDNYAEIVNELVKYYISKHDNVGIQHAKINVNFAEKFSLQEILEAIKNAPPCVKLSPFNLEMGYSESEGDSESDSSDLDVSVQTVNILDTSSKSSGANSRGNAALASRESSASSALNSSTPPKSEPREIPVRRAVILSDNPDPSPQLPAAAAAAVPRGRQKDLVVQHAADPSPPRAREEHAKSEKKAKKITVIQSATLFVEPKIQDKPKDEKKGRRCTIM